MHPLLATARRWHARELAVLDYLRDGVFLVLRLYFGYKLAVSGWGKVANPTETAAYFRDLHIPMPELNVYLAGGAELVGGVCLALGLASRVMTLPVIGTMLVAYATAHEDQWAAFWSNTAFFFKAPPFPYLFTAVVVLLCGPGRLSADHLVGRWLSRRLGRDPLTAAPGDRP